MQEQGNRMSAAEEWQYAEKAMAWHGWGSAVGLGIFVVCLALAALLVRLTIFGF